MALWLWYMPTQQESYKNRNLYTKTNKDAKVPCQGFLAQRSNGPNKKKYSLLVNAKKVYQTENLNETCTFIII